MYLTYTANVYKGQWCVATLVWSFYLLAKLSVRSALLDSAIFRFVC